MSEFGSPPPAKKKSSARMVVVIIILAIALIFMLQNLDSVPVNILWMSVNMPAWLLMVIMFVLGMLLGGVVRGGFRKLRGKDKQVSDKK